VPATAGGSTCAAVTLPAAFTPNRIAISGAPDTSVALLEKHFAICPCCFENARVNASAPSL
jgi:hypothetical protein